MTSDSDITDQPIEADGEKKDETMAINLKMPDITELKPRITVFGVGGAGGNAVNNMIQTGLLGCDFVVSNTDAQALAQTKAERVIQMGVAVTEGLGAGSQPEVGCAAAEEVLDEIKDHLAGSHMVFITAGMGGGTGTGAAPVIARAAREQGILTVGVVTKPFQFEGQRRMRVAEEGITELQKNVDTLIVIPNQNLFRIANERTTFADAFAMADEVLYSGVACITDLMVKEGLINLDFADVRSIMNSMGKAMMGTGEASAEGRAIQAAEAAIANPLLDETSMKGARGLLISITGGNDMTLFEVDEAASRIREEVDVDANIILGATFDESLEGIIRVSVVATGIEANLRDAEPDQEQRLAALADRLRHVAETQSNAAAAAAADRLAPRANQPVSAAPAQTTAPQPAQTSGQPKAAPAARTEVKRPAAPVNPGAPKAQAAPEQRRTQAAVAVETDPDVMIEPFKPAPIPALPEQARHETPVRDTAPANAGPYIPPATEAPQAAPRALSIDDFPAIARRETEEAAHQGEEDDRRPMSLLRRIASGLGRKDEDEASNVAAPQTAQPVAPQPVAPQPVARQPAPQQSMNPQQTRPAAPAHPAPQMGQLPEAPRTTQIPHLAEPQMNADPQQFDRAGMERLASDRTDRPAIDRAPTDGSLYRPRQGDLDAQGRAVPRPQQAAEDDQLEIPAFLRRQSR